MKRKLSKGSLTYYNKGSYKNEEKYLEAIYNKKRNVIHMNPELIASNRGSEKKAFIEGMKKELSKGKTPREAFGTIRNSSTYTHTLTKQEKDLIEIERLYNKNYDKIHMRPERVAAENGSEKTAFIEAMKVEVSEGKTPKQAFDRVMNSSTYSDISPQEASHRGTTRFLNKATKAGLKRPRNSKGQFTKFDLSKLNYRGSGKSNGINYIIFEYNGQYIVEFRSPKDGSGATIFVYNSEAEARASL